MTDGARLHRALGVVLSDDAPTRAPDSLRADVFTLTTRMRPRPRWLALLKERPMRLNSHLAVGSPMLRITSVMTLTVILLTSLAAAVTTGAALLRAPAVVSPDDWSMYRGDPARQGAGLIGPMGDPLVRWRYQAGGAIVANISVVGDLVYAVSSDDVLHALDRTTGTVVWDHPFGPGVTSGPSVADGSIYLFYGEDRNVTSIDAVTGTERWTITSTATWDGTRPTFGGGAILANSNVGDLVSLDEGSGAVVWRYPVSLTGAGVSNPAYADGVVYAAAGQGGGLAAVDARRGALLWRADTGGDHSGTPVVTDGVVYLGAGTDGAPARLRAFDLAGSPLWTIDEPFGSPAVSGDIVISTSYSGDVTGRAASDGSELWRVRFPAPARTPAVANDVAYVPVDDGAVVALDATTGRELWRFEVPDLVSCCISVAGGTVYVGTATGEVLAIGGGETPASGRSGAQQALGGSEPPSAASAPATEGAGLVGTWRRYQTCEEFVAALARNGVADQAPDFIRGADFPVVGPEAGASSGDQCRGYGPKGLRLTFRDNLTWSEYDEVSGEEGACCEYRRTGPDSIETVSDPGDPDYPVHWHRDGDSLTLDILPFPADCSCPGDIAAATWFFGLGPWQLVSATLPDGTYQAHITAEEMNSWWSAAGFAGDPPACPCDPLFSIDDGIWTDGDQHIWEATYDGERITIRRADGVGHPISMRWVYDGDQVTFSAMTVGDETAASVFTVKPFAREEAPAMSPLS